MGDKYQVISSLMVPGYEQLPGWFKDRWERYFDFSRDFWVSNHVYGLYHMLIDFEGDVQKVVQELGGAWWRREVRQDHQVRSGT